MIKFEIMESLGDSGFLIPVGCDVNVGCPCSYCVQEWETCKFLIGR